MRITHAFTSPKADGSDTSLVRPSNWNADHVITGSTSIYVDVRDYGATGNGSTDDYAAIQAAIDAAAAIGSATVYFPKGTYRLTASLTITHGKGINLLGEGDDKTILNAGAFPAVKTVGYWRSLVQGLQFSCNANTTGGAFQLDGETDGSFGVQQITFLQCAFYGSYNSKYSFTNCLVAGGAGQGSECTWISCAFGNVRGNSGDAAFLNGGSNALQNTLLGCNFQSFNTGVMVAAGNVDILHCGFQSTYGLGQITNSGFDVDGSSSNVGDCTTMTGCRTESLQIYKGGGNAVHISNFGQQQGAAGSWATGAKSLNALVRGQTTAGNVKLYKCTTAGTSGAGQPTWPESGTVADGTAVWTQLNFNVFDGSIVGIIERGQMQLGQFGHTTQDLLIEDVFCTRDDVIDTTAGYGGISGPGPRVKGLRLGGAPPPGSTTRPVFIGNNTASGARNTGNFYEDLAGQTLSWGGGTGGGSYYQVSFSRGAGDYNQKAGNWIAMQGGLAVGQVTFAQIGAATISDGVAFFVTDGTPGSNPLTGGGTGCLAARQNGVWKALSPGDKIGYTTGSGGAVTQLTSRTTGVTLNKPTGAITLVSAAGSASWQSFTVTNSTVAATDTIIVSQKSGTDKNMIFVTAVAAGSFQITFATTGGTTTEQPVFNFAVVGAVAS